MKTSTQGNGRALMLEALSQVVLPEEPRKECLAGLTQAGNLHVYPSLKNLMNGSQFPSPRFVMCKTSCQLMVFGCFQPIIVLRHWGWEFSVKESSSGEFWFLKNPTYIQIYGSNMALEPSSKTCPKAHESGAMSKCESLTGQYYEMK